MAPLYLTVNFINHELKNTSAVNIPIGLKWEHRTHLQIKVDADFLNSDLFIFTKAKHVVHVLTVQGQRMWNDLADAYETS